MASLPAKRPRRRASGADAVAREEESAELKWVLDNTVIRLYETGVQQTRDIGEAHSFVWEEKENQWVPALLDLPTEFPLVDLRKHLEELLISVPYHMHAVLPYPRYHTGVGLAGFVPSVTLTLVEGAPPAPDEIHVMTIERSLPEEGEDEEDEYEMVENWIKLDVAPKMGYFVEPFPDILKQVQAAIVNHVLPIYQRRKIANAALLEKTELPTAVIENVLNGYMWDYQRKQRRQSQPVWKP